MKCQIQFKKIQNELIEVTGEWLCNSILKEVKHAKFYAIVADEVADVSNKGITWYSTAIC